MHSRLIKGTLIVLGWQLIAPGLAQADESLLQTGQRHFNRHEYSSAEDFFRVASQSQPPSAEAHYWYATTLAKRFRGSEAIIEYQRCLALDPSPLIASYCRAAIAGYRVVQQQQYYPARPTSINEDPRGMAAAASERIQNEVAAERTRLQDIGLSAANEKRMEGAELASRYMARISPSTQQLLNQPTLGLISPKVSDRDLYYKEMADRESRRAHDSVSAIDHDYQDRQNALSESAASLQEQLRAAPTAHTSTLLQPFGTNIYVRNYEPIGSSSDDDDIVVQPMKAHAEKFNQSKSVQPQNQP